jgi:fatty acid desaturase
MARADAIAEAYESRLNERSTQSSIVAGVALVSLGILYVVALGTVVWLWPFWVGGY